MSANNESDKTMKERRTLDDGIDGNDFLHSLRSSIPSSHYNGGGQAGQSNDASPPHPMVGERFASAPMMMAPSFPEENTPTHNNKQGVVSLQDVLQAEPVEYGGDTALLQTIEDDHHHDAHSPRHRTVATGTSTILSNAVDENNMVHDFELEDLPPMANDDKDQDDEQNDASSQRRPLLQHAATQGRSSRRNIIHQHHHHRGGKSVEQMLLDLTEALSEMHGTTPIDQRRHHHRHTTSTADEFADNALRLHAQQHSINNNNHNTNESNQDGTTDNDASNSTTAVELSPPLSSPGQGNNNGRRLWDSLLESLPTLREQASQQNSNDTNGINTSASSDGANSGEDAGGVAALTTEPVVDLEMGSAPTSQLSTNKPSSHKSKKSQGGEHGHVIRSDTIDSEIRRNGHYGPKSSTVDKFKEDWQVWTEFFRPRRKHMITYVKTLVLYMILPAVGIAAILYYFLENPPTGTLDNETGSTGTGRASASYILLFCCRQLVTFSLAFATQIFLIDFIALNTRIMLNLLGPVLTLLVVQSKGWPCLLTWWSIYDFALLAGNFPFVHHWLFFQSTIGLFSERNPSGQLVNDDWYWRALTIAISVSLVVSVKRFVVGLYLGRATFSHYGEPLAKAMSKMLLVGEVAAFAKDIERVAAVRGVGTTGKIIQDNAAIHGLIFRSSDEDENETVNSSSRKLENSARSLDLSQRDPLTEKLQYSEKIRLMQLLEQWEEPTQHDDRSGNESASISAVLRFRKALTFIQKKFPFGKEFGSADTRAACIESAQDVYRRLMMATPGEDILSFETIAFIALEDDGTIDQAKVKTLIKLFRPDRKGNLSLLDFCKSVDAIYKEFRFLGATIQNSSQIDRAFEHIVNAIFYIVVFCIILSQLGFDPLALFLSLSSVILAFAFMIGSASAKYFEGILFILGRRPFGIGDRIQIGGVETDSSLHGILPWTVVNVTLFETTLVYLPTNERASLSNGSLANSRIVNWARSPQAQFHIFLQFPLDTPYQKLVLFKKAVEEYMRARPREWRALNGFRCNMVYAKENYMEYLIVIQHREAWQEVGQVLDSKANLTSYCQEVARQLDMEYQAPRVPIHLKHEGPASADMHISKAVDEVQFDEASLTHKFADIAHTKHSIRVC